MWYSYSHLVVVGAEAVTILSNRISQIHVQTRFMADKNAWPPGQPKTFTPLLLVHHQGYCTTEQVTTMAELMCSGDIDKVALATGDQSIVKHPKLDGDDKFQKTLGTSRATKEVEDILAPLENCEETCYILIEGAPGIGKSVLLQEIVYRWSKKTLLHKVELVLLVCLRDPSLQQVRSVDDLLQLFCIGDKNATEIASACSKYLLANGGKGLILLFDGYDEYPEYLRERSLVASILQRQVLPFCGLVVSSRPHASEYLREQASIRVDILGFTETEREHYIKQALPDQPHKVKELTQYLHQQPSVDSICFIPFNMVVLLYLYKLGIPLPKNSTELYRHFICSTICRHLTKLGYLFTHNITSLADLPEPYSKIIMQLSKLSLKALNNNRLIFTLDDITAACPDIAFIPGAINGFGLLQAVKHFGLYTKKMTLNFIHFTIQEFLAAHYISHLPPSEEFKVIKANFWSDIHFNMFSIYISLTKGQRPSFKQFLSGGNTTVAISPKFLTDRLKCLRLYHCFEEAGDHMICNTIEQASIFQDKIIFLPNTTLTASDMECISLFLTSSCNKKWVGLYLCNCHIQDKGLSILCRGLRNSSDTTIDQIVLNNNDLTRQSSSLISELTIKCKTKILWINGNSTIGEDQHLYAMLTNPSTVLQDLSMASTNLSCTGAIQLFTALKDNNTLKQLLISFNDITDDACDVITTALEKNDCLVRLNMHNNPLSRKAIIDIMKCLKINNTLQLIGFSDFVTGMDTEIISLQQTVNKNRENRECQVILKVDNIINY